MNINFTKTSTIFICAVICTLLWGSAFPCVKIGYQLLVIEQGGVNNKILFAGIRFFLSGIILCILYIATNVYHSFKFNSSNKIEPSKCLLTNIKSKPLIIINNGIIKKNIKAILLVSLFQTCIQYIFFYIGLSNTPGVKSSIINSSSTFILIILACLIYKNEHFTFNKILGCIFGSIGIILININGLTSDNNLFSFKVDGELLLIFASISFAIGSLLSKKYATNISPLFLTAFSLLIGGLLLILIGLILGGHLYFSYISVFILLYLALLSAISSALWTILLKYNDASKIAIYNFLTPVFGTILSGIILNEEFANLYMLLSLALISLGIILINHNTQN